MTAALISQCCHDSRCAGFAFFGIYGTERNLNWLTEVEAVVPKGAAVSRFQMHMRQRERMTA